MDVDTDRASMGWTIWDLAGSDPATVKAEPRVFKSLRPHPGHVIGLDTPSPKKRKSHSLSSPSMFPPMNPTNGMQGLANATDEETKDSLEQLLEAEMDLMHGDFPDVGQAPEDDL